LRKKHLEYLAHICVSKYSTAKNKKNKKKEPDNLCKRSICPFKLRATFSKKKNVDRNIVLKFPSNATQLKKVYY
jgi:hypothetical protein